MNLDVIYSDEDVWVINKPSGVSLLRDRAGESNLWDQIKRDLGKPYMVHRLDKGTSGVLIIARHQSAQSRLTRSFGNHQVEKFYLAWVVGLFPTGHTLTIDMPLCKGRKSRYRVAGERKRIVQRGKRFEVTQDREGVDAVTKVRCLRHNNQHSLMLLNPIHGRTHQLRVHMSWLGHAIVGDHLYGAQSDPAQQHPRLQLHCHKIVILQQTYKSHFDLSSGP
ncbi:MAG: RNA pseudouridine synthase [Pseudomonadota bacterium]